MCEKLEILDRHRVLLPDLYSDDGSLILSRIFNPASELISCGFAVTKGPEPVTVTVGIEARTLPIVLPKTILVRECLHHGPAWKFLQGAGDVPFADAHGEQIAPLCFPDSREPGSALDSGA